MEKIVKNLKTYACGVMAMFDQDASRSSNIEVCLDYYRLVQDILKVNHIRFSHFTLDVKWFKVIKRERNDTIHFDPCGLYTNESKDI